MKYGVYGGAFNPMHLEHLAVMINAKKELGLDKVVILPSGNAPHKKTLVDFADRVKMIEMTIKDDPDYLIDDLEEKTEGLTNTAKMLPLLKEKYGDIVFIIGGDSFNDLETWIRPDVILSYPLAVVTRAKGKDEAKAKAKKYNDLGSSITVLDYVGKDVSSTEIRTRLMLGLPVFDVCPEVVDYAKEKGFYDGFKDILESLKAKLPAKRYDHTLHVALCAIKLNSQLKLDKDKVILSALLHDSSKYSQRPHPEIPEQYRNGPIAHAFIGAEEIQTDYGITDPDIINAVRYHTTGRANMSDLERLIYLADLLEDTRDFDGVQRLRDIAYRDFDQGFKEAVASQRKFLGNGENICPLTFECYDYYVLNSKKRF